jgi:hypothetical protein
MYDLVSKKCANRLSYARIVRSTNQNPNKENTRMSQTVYTSTTSRNDNFIKSNDDVFVSCNTQSRIKGQVLYIIYLFI